MDQDRVGRLLAGDVDAVMAEMVAEKIRKKLKAAGIAEAEEDQILFGDPAAPEPGGVIDVSEGG